MARSAADFIAEIQPIIRDRTENVVTSTDIINSLNRCIRYLINEHGIYATKNTSDLKVFPSIYEYPLPSDFHDIRELQDPTHPIKFRQFTATEFWKRLNSYRNTVAVDTVLGTKFLMVNMPSAGSKAVISNLSSLTDNGTWSVVAASDAVSVVADSATKKQGGASIRFNVDVSNSVNDFAAIENSTLTQVDLSSQEDIGTFFVWVYIPDVTNVTNITARWGSDGSNYYSGSATTAFSGLSFKNGWNRVGIAWEDTTQTGSPDSSAIDYLYLQLTYSSSQTDMSGVRFDDAFFATPESMELSYYSTSFVQDGSDSSFKAKFETTDDISLFADDDDDMLFYWCLGDAQWILELFNERQESQRLFTEALRNHKVRYLSERKPKTARYINRVRH